MRVRLTDFAEERQALIRNVRTADHLRIAEIFMPHGGVPTDYRAVIEDVGACDIQGADEPDNWPAHLRVLTQPVSAIEDYYADDRILSLGARGDVLVVATDSMGGAIGYDTGAAMRLVEVDNYRIVTPLPMTFDQMVYGILACWPQNPEGYADGVWVAGDGQRHSFAGPVPARATTS